MSNTFKYPSSDLDRSEALLSLLGSFWSSVYQGREFVSDVVSSKARLTSQTYQNLLELVASTSRLTIPVFHREYWSSLVIRESQFTRRKVDRHTFGSGLVYGDLEVLAWDIYLLQWANNFLAWASDNPSTFGEQVEAADLTLQKLPSLVRAPLIVNRMLQPSVVLTENLDYRLTDSRLEFIANPFDNELIPKIDIFNVTGEIVDREITLWVYHGEWDLQYVYNQFGYALGIHARSSENYKQLINAILDASVSGTSSKSQQLALSAVTGLPLVVESQETVEHIYATQDKTQVITNQHVYSYPAGSAVSVTPGQTVYGGDSLTDDFQIFELNRGSEKVLEYFQFLTISPAMLSFDGFSSVTFLNKDVPLVAETQPNGRLKVSWELVGFPLDVERLWDETHSRGIAADQTLAELLDQREEQVGPTTAGHLPATVNPLQFLVDNVLRNNVWVVRLRQRTASTGDMATASLEHFRRVQPPHTCLIIVQELVVNEDSLHPEDVESEIGYWYSEQVAEFAPTSVEEGIDFDTNGSETVTCYYLDGGCFAPT
jgi:hypothetical protein